MLLIHLNIMFYEQQQTDAADLMHLLRRSGLDWDQKILPSILRLAHPGGCGGILLDTVLSGGGRGADVIPRPP